LAGKVLGWLVLLYLEKMKRSSNDSNGVGIVSHEEEKRGMLQRQENKRRKQTNPA
jgi:hypothetical protein